MSSHTPIKRVLYSRTLTLVVVGVLGVVSILYGSFALRPQRAFAANATNSTLNFQARLETDTGAIVPDGYYNVQFKLYDGDTSGGPAGKGAGFAGTNLWTETYQNSNSQGIQVHDGYLTANLGSITAFPGTINWDQGLWLTLNVGGTTSSTSVTWDGEMNPRLKLTGVPYAFRAGELATYNSSADLTSTLTILQPTVGNQIFQIPNMGAAGTYTICVQGGSCGGGGGGSGVSLQATSPGTPDTGNFNVSGTGIAAILQAGTFDTASATTLNLGTTNATNITIGSSSSTGTITIGQSTASNTISVGNGTIAAGNTETVNIATSATSTGKTVVAIGSPNGASGISLRSGTGGVSLTSTGQIVVQSTASSSAAFQLQDSMGNGILTANSTAVTPYLNYAGFEAGTATPTGWSSYGSPSVFSRETTPANIYDGNGSLKITTTGVNQGAITSSFAVAPAAGTWRVSFFVKLASGTMNSNVLQATLATSAGNVTVACSSTSLAVDSTGFRGVACTGITTTATATSLVITQSDATARTFYLDEVSLNPNSGNRTFGAQSVVQLPGVISTPINIQGSSNSTAAFSVLNASGNTGELVVNTLDDVVYVGGSLNVSSIDALGGNPALQIGTTQATSITIGGAATAGTITIGQSTASNTISVGNGTIAAGNTETVNIATSATSTGKTAVNIGSPNGASSLSLQAGTGNLQLQTQGGTLGIGNNAVAQSIVIGNTTAATTVSLQGGSSATALALSAASGGTLSFGSSGVANTINIGNTGSAGAVAQTINIGTNSTAGGTNTILIGNASATASTVRIEGGTGASAITLSAGTGSTISVGDNGADSTVQVGNTTGGVNQTVNVGTNGTAGSNNTVTLGSLVGMSTTTIQGGSGGINLTTSNTAQGVIVRNNSNTTAGFVVQNSDAQPLFLADTTHPTNLINNGGFDALTGGVGGWTAIGTGASISRTVTPSLAYSGQGSMAITLGSVSGTGAQAQSNNIVGNSLAAGTYTLSFFAEGSAAITGLAASLDGGGTCTLSSTSVSAAGYQKYVCTVTTTGATTTVSITAATTGQTLYVDSVQLQTGSVATPYSTGTLQLGGVIGSPLVIQDAADATSVFQIQNAASSNILFNADTLNGRIGIGTANAAYTLDVAGIINSSVKVLTPLVDTATAAILNIGTTNATGINLNKNVTVAAGQYLSLVGGITSTRPASPTEGMLYYDTTTKSLLTYANGKWQADRSNSTLIVGTSASGGTSGAVASKAPDGADYVNTSTTSAQTTINSAIAALPATGGSIYLMEGTYVIDGSISLPDNVMLTGSGTGTIIKFKNGINANFRGIVNKDTSTGTRITVKNLAIDGNKANQSGSVGMGGIEFNGVGGGSGSTAREGAIISNVTIRDVYYSSGTATGAISFLSSAYSTVSNNILSTSNAGVIGGLTNSTITGNVMQADGTGIYMAGTVSNDTITGNTINGSTANGMMIDFTSNSVISGNKIHDSGGSTNNEGIILFSSAFKNTITDNDISDTSCTTNCYAIDIQINTASNNYLSNNRIVSPETINDLGTGTIYANQLDGSGNLINKSLGGGLTVGKSSASSSLDIQGTLRTTALPAPSVSLGTVGSGTATYGYKVTALDGSGESLPSTEVSTTSGPNTLNGSNYTIPQWSPVGGAVQYKVYRTTVTGGTPSTTGLIATVAGNVTSVNDTGLAASGSVPTANTTGNALLGGGSLTLGTGSSTNGTLLFANSSNANSVTIVSGVTTTSFALTLPTALGNSGDCLKQTNGTGALGFGACGTGSASTLQDAYNASSTTSPQILLNATNGGVKIGDAATPISGNLFSVQNNAATATYLGISASALTLQNSSGYNAMIFDSTSNHLKIYEAVASPTHYADIYYDNSSGEAVFTASSGTTRVGSGSGNVTISLTNQADVFQYTKSATLSSAYSSDDALIQRNITAGANALTGSVLRVESISTGSSTVASNILWLNENNTSATGNLILATKGGASNAKFTVDDSGNVTIGTSATFNGGTFSGTTFTGPGGVTVTAAAANALTLTSPTATTWSTTSGNLTLQAGGANKLVLKPGTDSTDGLEIQNAGGSPLLVADTSSMALKVGGGDVGANTTPVLLVVDHSTSASDPTGVNGAMYYNESSNKFRCYQNSQWADCTTGETYVRKTADQLATQNSTTMQNATDLTYSLAANATYTYDATILVDASNSTADWRYTVTVPTGSTIINRGETTLGQNSGSNALCNFVSSGTVCSVATSGTGHVILHMVGTVSTSSTSGNWQFQFAQDVATASAGSPSVLANSMVKFTRIQ